MRVNLFLLDRHMHDHSRKSINFQSFSGKDKAHLKKRIANSIFGHKRRKRGLRYGLGIVLVAIVGSLFILMDNNSHLHDSQIEAYAKTLKAIEPVDQIQLVLSDERQIEVVDDHSMISYSKTGEQVQIGNEKSVSQTTSNSNEVVFNTLIVPYGKRSEITLSDGSKVWLNSGSKLVFPAHFAAHSRKVYLEGEAIFEVTHRQDQPFLVTSKDHEIHVLGTVFNVSNYTDDSFIYTILKSGSVQINLDQDKLFGRQKSFSILPGTLATFDRTDKSIHTEPVDIAPYFSWREGIFIFKNDALQTIMKRLSRYYNVDIIINDADLAKETFSGHLDVKENIETVMQTIKETDSSKFDYHFTTDHQLIIN